MDDVRGRDNNETARPTRNMQEDLETQQLPVTSAKAEEQRLAVPAIEEYLEVNKDWVQSGEVVVRKHVEATEQTIPVDVEYEEVQVDRVPVGRQLAYGEKTEPWWDGDVMVVPVVEEEIVVTKRQILREELRIYKRRLSRREEVTGTVRRQQVDVETRGNVQRAQDETGS